MASSAKSMDRSVPVIPQLIGGAWQAAADTAEVRDPSCESLPLVCSLAATQLGLAPSEALGACTVNAAHVLGRADRLGRIAPGYRADLVLLDAPDWRYLAYHLGGQIVAGVVTAGELR
jgi:imidazolonepropionase